MFLSLNKKYATKNYFIFLVIFVMFFCGCKNNSETVYGGGTFFADDEALYYVNQEKNLCKYSFDDSTNEKLLSDFFLEAFSDKYFIGYSNNIIKIYDRNSSETKAIQNIDMDSVAVSGDSIYYSNKNDNNFIYEINIITLENTLFLNESTNSISANSNYIFYEKDLNSVYEYDLHSGEAKEVFSGGYCFFFYCDDNNIYLSDYLQNNKIVQIDIVSGEYNLLYDISAMDFYIYNNKLYFQPKQNEDEITKFVYHIYEYDGNNETLII